MTGSRWVTLKDIADALGISRGTVDRVMHGRGRVSEDTRDRIVEKARELGYVPNQSARMLAMRQSLTIAVLRPASPRAFFHTVARGVAVARDELLGFGLSVDERTTHSHDESLQQRQISEAVEAGVDGIALVAAHRSRLDGMIARASDAGIPVVTFNSDAPESERVMFVGQDLYRSGRVAGELIGRFVGGGGSIGILTGFSELWAHQERVRGIEDSIAEYFPGTQLLGPFEYHDEIGEAERLARRLLDEEATIRGFVSTTGIGHTAVGRVLLERSLAGKIQNIGFDVDEEVRDLMHQNAIQASIGQDPFLQGYLAVKLLFHHLTNREVQEKTVHHTKIEVLLRSTIDHVAPENEPYFRAYSRREAL